MKSHRRFSPPLVIYQNGDIAVKSSYKALIRHETAPLPAAYDSVVARVRVALRLLCADDYAEIEGIKVMRLGKRLRYAVDGGEISYDFAAAVARITELAQVEVAEALAEGGGA